MTCSISRPTHGLFVFLGRFELQSRVSARAHHHSSDADSAHGPDDLKRDLANMRDHHAPVPDLDDDIPLSVDVVYPPVARPARPCDQGPGPNQRTVDPRAPTRTWFRFPTFGRK